MEPIEDVEGAWSLFGDNPQVGSPHVAADKPQDLASFWTKPVKETPECFGRPIAADPEQTPSAGIELIDQGDKFIFRLPPADFISANGLDMAQITVSQPPFNGHLDRSEDIFPSGLKSSGDLQPGETFCPCGEKPCIGCGQMVLALCPGNLLDFNAANRTINSPPGVEKENCDPPQRNEFETARSQGVVSRTSFAAAGTDRTIGLSMADFYFQNQPPCMIMQTCISIDKTFVPLKTIQYSSDQHLVSPFCLEILVDIQYAKRLNEMRYFYAPSGNDFIAKNSSAALTGTHRFC
jgi:hypothetical protein